MSRPADVPNQLAQITSSARSNPSHAQQRLGVLVLAMGPEELRIYESDIRKTIASFLPKRRKALTAQLEGHLSAHEAKAPAEIPPSRASIVTPQITYLSKALQRGLADLSNYHIFLWSTFYRDFLSTYFTNALEAAETFSAADAVATATKSALMAHATEIFAKGFRHVTDKTSQEAIALGKSLGGLQRFLELPIEFYSARVATTNTPRRGLTLRRLCSGMLAGILRGYAGVSLGSQHGARLLAQNPRLWLHYSPFLTRGDLEELISDCADEPLAAVMLRIVPLVQALDQLLESPAAPTLPVLSQLLWEQRRLDVSLLVHLEADFSHLLEIQCVLEPGYAIPSMLQEATARGTSLVMVTGALEPNHLSENQPARLSVIHVDSLHSAADEVAAQVHNQLQLAILKRRRRRLTSDPLTFNFAREFPLFSPQLTKFVHVERLSVRDLLRTVERRNGVRLWCSVRRSGKTVACFDLSDTAGPSTVVSQTSATIHPQPNATLFKDLVDEALAAGDDLSKSFFADAVKQSAAAVSPGSPARYVFVLDEYERLFGKLESVAATRRELEHRVVLPLLDQMAAFGRDNLLIFMGQQPDAHYILMAQNQLSAYVQQDSFPLFSHAGEGEEFSELIRKVFRHMAEFTNGFADGIFAETAGHPFLTVKLLVSLVDYLIESGRTIGDLHLNEQDVQEFSSKHLGNTQLSLNSEYDFFHRGIADALSPLGRQKDPWLHIIYRVLQRITRESPSTFRISLSDFRIICDEMRTTELGFGAERIARIGAQANFLELGQEDVGVRIHLLGRLASVSRESTVP